MFALTNKLPSGTSGGPVTWLMACLIERAYPHHRRIR